MGHHDAQLLLQGQSRVQDRFRALQARFSEEKSSRVALIDSAGLLRLYGASSKGAWKLKAAFQLQGGTELLPGTHGKLQEEPKWLTTPWRHFKVFPGRPGCILFCQYRSTQLLTVQLPGDGLPANPVHIFASLPSEVTCFDFGGGGTFVMSGDAGGGLRLWRTSDGVPLCARSGAHAGAVTCLASLDPHQAISGGEDGRVMTWAVHAGRLVSHRILHAAEAPIRSLAVYNPPRLLHDQPKSLDMQGMLSARLHDSGGAFLAAGSSVGELLAWRMDGGRIEGAVFSGTLVTNGAISALSFSPDGSRLCVGSGQHSGNVWVFDTQNWSSRRLRGGFSAAIFACHMSAGRDFFVCTTEGLHPSRLQVPACLDSASSGGRWTQHTALNQIQSSNGGWIETLEPNRAVSRMAPPVPDFLGPFRKEAPSVQGWEAVVPAAAWARSSAAGNVALDPAPRDPFRAAALTARSAAPPSAALHASSASSDPMATSLRVGEARKYLSGFGNEGEEPSPLPRALQALALRSVGLHSPAPSSPKQDDLHANGGCTAETQGGVYVPDSPAQAAMQGDQITRSHAAASAADTQQQSPRASSKQTPVQPTAGAVSQSQAEALVEADADSERTAEQGHPWDSVSNSAASSATSSAPSESASACCRSESVSWHDDCDAASQPVAAHNAQSTAVNNGCERPRVQRSDVLGGSQHSCVPARALEACEGNRPPLKPLQRKAAMAELSTQPPLPGGTVQERRQLQERTAACTAEASAHLQEADSVRERIEQLCATESPPLPLRGPAAAKSCAAAKLVTADRSRAAARSGAVARSGAEARSGVGPLNEKEVKERARAYAAAAANLPKEAHKYHDLVKVEAEEPPVHAERLVRKQLRPGWQKLRAAQPCIDIAWAVNTRKALSIGTGQMTPRFEISAVGVAEAALRAL